MSERSRSRGGMLRIAGVITFPLCYLVMLSVVLKAARRPPAGQ